MNLELIISAFCQITPGLVRLNGEAIYSAQGSDSTDFLKAAYRGLQFSYPKFFKMDNLCKLAFLAAEPLLADTKATTSYAPSEIGIILQNASSSLETDEKHQQSIADREHYFPSPSVFVYTLPNIMAGEIAIRHGIKGENAVHICPAPDAGMLYENVSGLFAANRIRCCLAGWVEAYHDRLSSCLFLVEKAPAFISGVEKGENIIFDASNIERYFKDVL